MCRLIVPRLERGWVLYAFDETRTNLGVGPQDALVYDTHFFAPLISSSATSAVTSACAGSLGCERECDFQ